MTDARILIDAMSNGMSPLLAQSSRVGMADVEIRSISKFRAQCPVDDYRCYLMAMPNC